MNIPQPFYLIVDLEATCADDGSVPREEMEIIEIGAVIQDAATFEIVSEFDAFIRPVRHPELTDFCIELTTIRQEQVAAADSFPDVLAEFNRWWQGRDALFCSWGNYDRSQFVQDCEFHRVEYPFPGGHLNLKAEFASVQGLRKELGIAAALKRLGLSFKGTHHRGLDDARNIARIVRQICTGG